MTREVEKHLFIVCETCDEESSGHRIGEVRWGPDDKPICEYCHDQEDNGVPWKDLDMVEVNILKPGQKVGPY